MMTDGTAAHEGASAHAFEADALRCLDDVARFARSLTRAPDEADDLVQETYLRAFRSRHTWREGADMRRWLFTICKNVFLRSNERARAHVTLDHDPTDDALATAYLHNALVASHEETLFDRLSASGAIATALDALAEPFRLVVVLVDMEGYGYDDAATALGIPVGTVRSRLFRARRMLQESLIAHARDAGLVASRASHTPKTTS